VSLINVKETRRVRELEKRCQIRFEFGKIPDGKAICAKQLYGAVEKILHTDVNQNDIADYLPSVFKALEHFDKEELIKRMVSAEFNRFSEYYKQNPDMNVIRVSDTDSSKPSRSKERGNLKNTQRFLINMGLLDNINKGAIVRFICDKSGIRSNKIGEIFVNQNFSYFDVEKSAAVHIRNSLNNKKLDGRLVEVRQINDIKTPDKKSAAKGRRMH
jgi:ATP-dependent RNA helicase DeaD